MTGDAGRITRRPRSLHRERLFSEWDHRLRDKSRPQDDRLRDKSRPQDDRRGDALGRKQPLLLLLLELVVCGALP
jgi:hypothetical protein